MPCIFDFSFGLAGLSEPALREAADEVEGTQALVACLLECEATHG